MILDDLTKKMPKSLCGMGKIPQESKMLGEIIPTRERGEKIKSKTH